MGRVQDRLPLIGATLFALLIAASSFGQQVRVRAPHKPIDPPAQKRIKLQMPQTPRSMVGGLWMTDANLKSSIYIRSVVETDPVTVTPILWLSNGKQYTLPDVTIDPAGIAIISVNDALEKLGISPQATLSGYVELQYLWPWDPFCATVRNIDTAHSLIFTYALRTTQPPPINIVDPPPPAPTSVAEGMWWKQQASIAAFVAIANLSSDSAQASVQVTDSQAKAIAQHDLTISPHGMKLITLDELQSLGAAQGGIRVTSNETMDNLVISGGLEDPQTGYSAILPFSTTSVQDKPEAATIAEIGLMAGAADPMMQFPAGTTFTPYTVLRNVGDTALTLIPTLWWMESGAAQSAQLPAVSLQAYETGSLDVISLLAQFGPKNFNGSVNLVFDGEARRGSLVMASGSVDQTGSYVFEVVPRGVMEGAAKSIQYWSTGNGDDTMVSVWNPADEAQDFVLTLYFKGGHYALPLHLDPRTTRMFDISQVIQNQVPDADGNLIPPSVHEGTAKIAGSQAENEHILVAIDVGVYNVRKATCTNQCQECDGYSQVVVVDDPFGVVINGNHQENIVGTWNTGGQFNIPARWTSNHTNIATVSNGLVHGVSVGAVTVTGMATNVPVGAGYVCTGPQGCPLMNITTGGGGTVFQVTNVLPFNLVLGGSGILTIYGQGFQSLFSPVAQFDPGSGITTGTPTVVDDGHMTVTYQVTCGALIGSQTLQVGSLLDGGISGTAWPENVVLPAAPAPTIKLGGNTISGPQSVVVGQQIALSSSYSLPACVSTSAPTWSAAGTTVGGFNTGQQNGGPTTPNFAQASTLFYWVNPGASLSVTYQYTMSGGGSSVPSPLATATFNVAGATVSNMSTPTGSVGIFAGPVLGYSGPGIKFTATSAPPTGYTGRFEYVQLITNDTITLTTTGGTTQTCVNVTQPATPSGTGLDTVYPYDTGKSTKDSPALNLDSSAYSQEGRVFAAKMYFLWDPALPANCTVGSSCTSIPVPLGSATWGFSGTATYSAGNWSLTSSSKTAPSWSLGGTHPSWQALVPYTGNLSCH